MPPMWDCDAIFPDHTTTFIQSLDVCLIVSVFGKVPIKAGTVAPHGTPGEGR